MQFLKKTPNFGFMAKRRVAVIFSAILILISLGSMLTRGFNFGIDFTGGTLIEVGYKAPAALDEVRGTLSDAGFGSAIVQHFGTSRDVLIRIPPQGDQTTADISTNVLQALKAQAPEQVEMRRVEFVGPQVGEELTEDGGLAIVYALIGILIYVTFRFEKRFALGSVIALVHDVVITLGFFSLTQMEFDLPVLAALLAVIGYSLNDTIVVFDRIRENFLKLRKDDSKEVIDTSLNQTLSRTVMTSVTTLLVLVALAVFGGEIIHGFAMALIVGVVIGTYSSIYVASTAVLALGVTKEDLMPPEKEGEELDDLP